VRLLGLKFALILAAFFVLSSGLRAQQIPKAAIGDAATQKQRAARFLARRGLLHSRGGFAAPLAQARTQTLHQRKPGIARLAGSPNVTTSLTAPWQPIGPPQVSTTAYGLVTGRVTSIAADPSDATGNTVYVGSTGGGVWKSTNAANGAAASVSFTPLTDTLGAYAATSSVSLSIGALSVQPGGTGVILVGTGDPNDATDSYYGSGILRSADSGVTWSLITLTIDQGAGTNTYFTFVGNSFAGLAWSTTSPGTVVAAVSSAAEGLESNAGNQTGSIRGLYYSQDAGQTWQLATISDAPGTVIQSDQTLFRGRGNAATSVVWNPIRKMFYAAVQFHGYYQSADGINWTRLTNQPGANLTPAYCPPHTGSVGSPACPIFRGALAVQPVTGDLFALTVDINNLDQGLFQDVCGLTAGSCSSSTVTFANQIADTALEAGGGDTTIPQADYDLYLAAVPSQQDTLLFAGTSDIYRCSLANACAWRNTTYANTCDSAQVAPAQHAIDATFASLGLLYFGNDGGLWRSGAGIAGRGRKHRPGRRQCAEPDGLARRAGHRRAPGHSEYLGSDSGRRGQFLGDRSSRGRRLVCHLGIRGVDQPLHRGNRMRHLRLCAAGHRQHSGRGRPADHPRTVDTRSPGHLESPARHLPRLARTRYRGKRLEQRESAQPHAG
jgi:hypothetical protein